MIVSESKELFKKFCELNPLKVPVFSMHWWLDAVCGSESWNVIIIEHNNNVLACHPYFLKRKYGLTYVTLPPLTQYNGICIGKIDFSNNEKYYSLQHKIIGLIVDHLESKKLFLYRQSFLVGFNNWVPFYWKGYKQTTYYTYRVKNIKNFNQVLSGFKSTKRNELGIAVKSGLKVHLGLSFDQFYTHMSYTFSLKGKKLYFTYDMLHKLYAGSIEHNSGQILAVVDDSMNIHASIFIVWDIKVAYNIITSIDYNLCKSSKGSVMLFTEAIKFSSNYVDNFDFEGSMNEDIEKNYRQYGGERLEYYNINKFELLNLFR